MKGMLKLGVILALYATAACVGLTFVYSGTKETIAGQAQKNLDAALKDLFADADTFQEITGKIPSDDPAVKFDLEYAARQGDRVIGVAIQASTASYGGPIKVLIGVKADGTIGRIKILEHSDTPGLGANATKETFWGQFTGKSVGDAFEPKKDVTAITAATITSKAVSVAVKAVGTAGFAWLGTQTGGAQ